MSNVNFKKIEGLTNTIDIMPLIDNDFPSIFAVDH
jgi:hypothetical protein